jgi:GPI mannosyltransferase 3
MTAPVASLRKGLPAFSSWSEFHYFRFCLVASALLFLSTAVFSVGTYQADEYYQTVEFATTKLSIFDPAQQPWEYREEMRSWLQPALYVAVVHAANYFGIHRPLTLLFLFRLVTAAMAFSSLWALIVAGSTWINDESGRRSLYGFAAFLWLLPFVGARTSAETTSMAALCWGIACLEWRMSSPDWWHRFGLALLGGLALGLCFGFRYPSGVMAAGAGLFYLWRSAERFSLFLGLVIGVLSALVLVILADRWGYGHVTFSSVAYFYQNFVLGRFDASGALPFFSYLYLPIQTAPLLTPLILVVMLATAIAWASRPLSVTTWATAPYFAALCFITHKEVRFLFPLANFLPFFMTFALASPAMTKSRAAPFFTWLATGYRRRFLYVLNFCALLSVALLPQWSQAGLYEYIESENSVAGDPITIAIVRSLHKTPYEYVGGRMRFIEPNNVRWMLDPSAPDLQFESNKGRVFLALIDIPARPSQATEWIRNHCGLVWSSFPRWLQAYNINHWVDRANWWELYRCNPSLSGG